MLQYGSKVLALQRIFGHHLVRNPAYRREMQKRGMTCQDCSRKHVMSRMSV